MKSYLLFGVLLTGLITAGCGDKSGPQDSVPKQIDSKNLKKTVIIANMEEPITGGRNLVYCSTFQLAWNELKDDIVKDDIKLQNEPPIVKLLNKSSVSKGDISDKSYVAMAGFGKDGIIGKINNALKSKFGNEAKQVSMLLEKEDILAYAFLYKNLIFKSPYDELEYPIAFGDSDNRAEVKGFGIQKESSPNYSQIIRQVLIRNYVSNDDFIIQLISSSGDDEIILAKIAPEQTLFKTIEMIGNRLKNAKPEAFEEGDVLKIPKIDFNITHSYDELLGKLFRNKGFESYFATGAVQDIRFRLNEKGCLLKSEAIMKVECIEPDPPKYLVFDKPFLFYMKEKSGNYPYFVMWVDNAELMVKKD